MTKNSALLYQETIPITYIQELTSGKMDFLSSLPPVPRENRLTWII